MRVALSIPRQLVTAKNLYIDLDRAYTHVVQDWRMARKRKLKRKLELKLEIVTVRVTFAQLELLECWAEVDGNMSAVMRDLIDEKATKLNADHNCAKLSHSDSRIAA